MSDVRAPRWPRERCAPRADQRGDPMLGTAFPSARLLLIEEPFPWGAEGLRTSRFDPATALAVEARAREAGVRAQAIRAPGPSRRHVHRRWALVDTRDPPAALRWGEFTHDEELLELPLDGSTGEPDPGPLFLVCTHGKHDPCCAQRGRPVAAALADVRPGRVWQASHLGGCRFAPTVLVLPLGLMYGRVPPGSVPELVDACEAGEVCLPWLRGRIGTPPAAQAAIGFAHRELALTASRDIALRATTAVDWWTVLVQLDTPRGRFQVTVKRARVDATTLTCGAPGPSWFVAHHPQAITAIA